MYRKIRQTLIDRKRGLFNDQSKGSLINALFMFADIKPKNFGVYKRYAREEIEELVAHYEHDLCELAEQADADTLTRIANTLYILKTPEYENIWWRIEQRTNELAEEQQLDWYNISSILRAFSKS